MGCGFILNKNPTTKYNNKKRRIGKSNGICFSPMFFFFFPNPTLFDLSFQSLFSNHHTVQKSNTINLCCHGMWWMCFCIFKCLLFSLLCFLTLSLLCEKRWRGLSKRWRSLPVVKVPFFKRMAQSLRGEGFCLLKDGAAVLTRTRQVVYALITFVSFFLILLTN